MHDEKNLAVILLVVIASSICKARPGDTQQEFVL